MEHSAERPGETDLPMAAVRWLVTPDGLAAVAATTEHLAEGADAIEVGTRLRSNGLDPSRAAAVAEVAHARLRARDRWPDADALLFTRTALEQASDPDVSAWRARRYAGAVAITDLCAGIGGDALALAAAGGATVAAIDVDPSRLLLLRHNAQVRGCDLRPVLADATRPITGRGPVHADPSRRRGERRARHLGEYGPPVDRLLDAIGSRPAGVVVSPGVALDDPVLPPGEIEFVQVGTQLVEAVVWTGDLAAGSGRSATLLPSGDHRAVGADRDRLPVAPAGSFLLEVAPAAVRARLHDELGAEVGANRLADTRALLTTTTRPPESPWYRVSRIEAELALRAKVIRSWLREHAEDRPVTIVVHGVDADVDRWWRELGRPPRGEELRVHLVRTDTGGVCLVTGVPDR